MLGTSLGCALGLDSLDLTGASARSPRVKAIASAGVTVALAEPAYVTLLTVVPQLGSARVVQLAAPQTAPLVPGTHMVPIVQARFEPTAPALDTRMGAMRAEPIGGLPYETCENNPNEICTPPVTRQLTPVQRPRAERYVLVLATNAPIAAFDLDRALLDLEPSTDPGAALQHIARTAIEMSGATRWGAQAVRHPQATRWAVLARAEREKSVRGR
jgi:hypothetical protein